MHHYASPAPEATETAARKPTRSEKKRAKTKELPPRVTNDTSKDPTANVAARSVRKPRKKPRLQPGMPVVETSSVSLPSSDPPLTAPPSSDSDSGSGDDRRDGRDVNPVTQAGDDASDPDDADGSDKGEESDDLQAAVALSSYGVDDEAGTPLMGSSSPSGGSVPWSAPLTQALHEQALAGHTTFQITSEQRANLRQNLMQVQSRASHHHAYLSARHEGMIKVGEYVKVLKGTVQRIPPAGGTPHYCHWRRSLQGSGLRTSPYKYRGSGLWATGRP